MRAFAVALSLVACSAEPGRAPDVVVDPGWDAPIGQVAPAHLGHNTVWSRGGLGVWDEAAGAPRPEVALLAAALRPGMLRFPGGTRAMRYHFHEAIGPREARVAQCDTFTGALDATGYGLDEFLALAEELGASASLVSPWVDGSPEEAAALVAYVNADPSSTVVIGVDQHGRDFGTAGEWAARRVANGHPEPYRVPLLEIGNEPYLDQAIGPPGSCGRPGRFRQNERWVGGVAIPTTARDHAAQVARAAELVHAVDPSVRVGASAFASFDGETPVAAEVAEVDRRAGGDPWNTRLVADGGAFDVFVLHPYDFSGSDERVQLADRLRDAVRQLAALDLRPVLVSEFGYLLDGATLLSALLAADVVRVGVEEGLVAILRHILIEDVEGEPFAESAAIFGPSRTLTPAYHAMRLLAATLEPVVVASGASDGDLVALTTRDATGAALGVVLLDRRPDPGIPRVVRASLPPGVYAGTVTLLTGPAIDATAQEISITELPVAGEGSLDVTVPPAALVFLRLARM